MIGGKFGGVQGLRKNLRVYVDRKIKKSKKNQSILQYTHF